MHKTLIVETKSLTGSGLVLLLACTIFVSAFLLFQVQPLLSKQILPLANSFPPGSAAALPSGPRRCSSFSARYLAVIYIRM